MSKLLCEQNLRDVWCRNESVRAEIKFYQYVLNHYGVLNWTKRTIMVKNSRYDLKEIITILAQNAVSVVVQSLICIFV